MSGVGDVLAKTAQQGRAALIGYLPAGFPHAAGACEAMVAMVQEGVDIVEVGIPYTDPLMDGPVIQRAVEAALDRGFRIREVFDAVEAVAAAGAPALVMTSWNPVLRYGVRRFAADLAAAGGAGLITPDLIPDEAQDWIAAADEYGLDKVFLVAPSSTDQRLALTVQACRGFVYASAVMGVTGARSSVDAAAERLVRRVREVADLPACVGLGISTGAQAREVGRFADGVIVGSALVRSLADAANDAADGAADGPDLTALRELTGELAAGVRAGR